MDKQVQLGKKALEQRGLTDISREDMTMEEYQRNVAKSRQRLTEFLGGKKVFLVEAVDMDTLGTSSQIMASALLAYDSNIMEM